jgi:ribosomal protein S18 acetylase RimI-like enzyme
LNEFAKAEFLETFGQLRPILDPHTWLIAEVDEEPAGFCLGMPDLVPLLRTLQGRMGIAQKVRMLRQARTIGRYGLVAIGVRERFRGRHIGQTLACTLYQHFERLGMSSAPYYFVDENNLASRSLAESLGATGHVLLRCYRKELSSG